MFIVAPATGWQEGTFNVLNALPEKPYCVGNFADEASAEAQASMMNNLYDCSVEGCDPLPTDIRNLLELL